MIISFRSINNHTLNIHVQQNSSVVVRNFNTLLDLYATSLYQLILKNATRVFAWPSEIIL